MIRGVIFDRDGVLTRFDYAPVLALVKALPITFDQLFARWEAYYRAEPMVRSFVDEGALIGRFWSTLCDSLGAPDHVRASIETFDYTSIFRAYPDARPALEAARERGLRVGVLSNFPLVRIDASLTTAGLRDLVDVAIAAPMVGAVKPAAAAYQHALSALGVAADECVMVDDEAACVEGARAVGIRALRLERGEQRGEISAGVLRDLSEFGAVLDALGARGERAAVGSDRA